MKLFIFILSLIFVTNIFAADAPPTLRELELERALVQEQMKTAILTYQQLQRREQELADKIDKLKPVESKAPNKVTK